MFRKAIAKLLPSYRPTSLSHGLLLDGTRAQWVGVGSEDKLVREYGQGSVEELSKISRGAPVRTVVQGRSAHYGLVESSTLEPEQLAKEIPFPPGSYQIRSCPVPSWRYPGRTALFFAAALTRNIQELRSKMEGWGLEVCTVEVPVTALVREFLANRGPTDNPVMLCHICEESTHLVVVSGSHPYLARELNLGFRTFVFHQQMGSQSSAAEARQVLRRDGAPDSGPLDPILDSLSTEIRRTGLLLPTPVRQLFISGRGVIPGLVSRLQTQAELPACLDRAQATRWKHLSPEDHHYKIALGLVL